MIKRATLIALVLFLCLFVQYSYAYEVETEEFLEYSEDYLEEDLGVVDQSDFKVSLLPSEEESSIIKEETDYAGIDIQEDADSDSKLSIPDEDFIEETNVEYAEDNQESVYGGYLIISLKDKTGRVHNGTFTIHDSMGQQVAEVTTSRGKATLTEIDYTFLNVPGTYTVTQTGFPDTYFTAAGTESTLLIEVKANEYNELDVQFTNEIGNDDTVLKITNQMYVGNSSMEDYGMIYSPSVNTTTYVAFYSDEQRHHRVSGFYEMTVESGYPYKELKIHNIPQG